LHCGTEFEQNLCPYFKRFEALPKVGEYIKSERYIKYAPTECLTFGYWKYPGKGHPIRLLLEHLKVRYVDKQYDFSKKEEWFEQDKKALKLSFPNLPYLIDGETKMTESLCILSYLSRKYNTGLGGKTESEKF